MNGKTMHSSKLLAEFIGTFALVFLGAGAIENGLELTAVALAHGIAILISVVAFAHVSGAHFNPAVTIAMTISGRIGLRRGVPYIIAQLLGASFAALVLKAAFGSSSTLGRAELSSGTSVWDGMLLEAITAFLLVTVIISVAFDKRNQSSSIAGVAIGLTITADILAIGPLTGGTMNPARWFGPALIGNHWTDAFVWIIGPIVGGIVAVFIYDLIIQRRVPE